MYKITLIPGDGVGPEVVAAAKKCIEATGVPVKWEEMEAGAGVMEKYGTPLPDEVLESIRKNRVALKGPITTPVGSGFRSVNVAIRKALDLYACLRPYKWYAGARSRYPETNLVVVRENTEDLYAGIEFPVGAPETEEFIKFVREKKKAEVRRDSGISLKPISRFASERIVRFAFNYAKKNGRKKVTAVHKANIMKYSDGLFLEAARKVAQEFPDVTFEERIVDNMCMQLVQKPHLYDVIVAPNVYGDILSDLCAGLVGGLGMAPGANIGDKFAVFEPTHGSAPKYAGLNKVNPTAAILSGVMMLRHLGEEAAAEKLEGAVAKVIAEGKNVTYDFKEDPSDPSAVGTREMAEAIARAMR
ncbi:MAG: isocitrate/isopropylmalate dehydrogenase family protein [Candidatus Hodarchaeaceae archaeon]|nr:isocitrate/isopropylmalate dehydrogenase family protein [Candidatus Hodarchaeaceae archaeon]